MELPSRLKELVPLRVSTHDPDEVTTIGANEVDPAAVGLAQKDVDAIWAAVVRYYKMGLHPAITLCIRRRGEVVLDRAIGHSRGNGPEDPPEMPKELARPDGLFNLFSASKPVTAMLIHLLHERGLLHVDEPVATFVPEFARHRKQSITVADVLTHRAGIAAVPSDLIQLDALLDPKEVMERIYELRPTSRPGELHAYHAITGGFVLGEIIERVTGKGIRQFLQDEIVDPLGFGYFDYGVPEEMLDQVALESFTGPPPMWPAKQMIEQALSLSMRELVDVANDPRYRRAIVPSGNVICTTGDACRFFELLLCGGTLGETRIFDQRTVQRALMEKTEGIDRTLMIPVRYSMGFMLGNPGVSLFGFRAPRAFGHPGFTNVVVYADPERDLSVAMMSNGKPLLSAKFIAYVDIMRTIGAKVPRDRRDT